MKINGLMLFLLVGTCMGLAGTACAATEWSADPSLRVGQQYHENIRLTVKKHDAVWGTSIIPAVLLDARTPRSNTKIRAELRYVNYTKNEVKNRNLQDFSWVSRINQTRRSKWEITGSLRRDTVLTPIGNTSGNLPLPGIPPGIPDADEGADNDSRRNRLIFQPAWSYSITDRLSAGLAYRIYDINFIGDNDLLVDNRTQSFGPSANWRLTKRDKVGIAIRYSLYEAPDLDNETVNLSVTGKFERDFTDTLNGEIVYGMRRTDSKKGQTENHETNPIYKARITQYVFEATSYQLLLQRRLLPSSGGNVVESDRIDLRFVHRIKPTLAFSIAGRYFRNETVGGAGVSTNDRWQYFIRPRLSKSLNRNWNINFSYQYSKQRQKSDPRAADDNAGFVDILYKWI